MCAYAVFGSGHRTYKHAAREGIVPLRGRCRFLARGPLLPAPLGANQVGAPLGSFASRFEHLDVYARDDLEMDSGQDCFVIIDKSWPSQTLWMCGPKCPGAAARLPCRARGS
jgi:hypothetical protein